MAETNPKFEFVEGDVIVIAPGRTVKRIRALVTIALFGVVPGELGGYVESIKNIDAAGDAWVSGNAQVSGNAWVSGNAQVYGNARVYGNAWVSGNAQVYGDAWVSGNAQVSGNAWVSGDARVSGDAWVYGNARVSGNAWVYGNAQVYGNASKTPIHIQGLRWGVTIADTTMVIGCKQHTITEWHSFDTKTIQAMDSDALELWTAYKPFIFGIAKADGRFVEQEFSEVQ